MRPRPSPIKATNRTRKTLYVVAGFYVAVGLFMAAGAALAGDRLSAFLGFLIVSGALAAGLASSALLRLNAQLCEVFQALDDIRAKLASLAKDNHSSETRRANRSAAETASTIDLVALGASRPELLIARTLRRNEFPRLVTAVEAAPPDEPADAGEDQQSEKPETAIQSTEAVHATKEDEADHAIESTKKNLLRVWRVALRDGDLAACRSVFSDLVNIADSSVIVPLSAQLQELTRHTEQLLRSDFLHSLRVKDYAGALEVGHQIQTLFPDSRATLDFTQIKPTLEARLQGPAKTDSLRLTVVQ